MIRTTPWALRGRQLLSITLVTLTGFALASPASAASAAPKPEPVTSAEVDGMLKNMSNYMASLKSFSVDTTNTTEAIDTNGQKLNFTAQGEVSVMRPNMLVAHRVDANQDASIYFDGKNVTVYAKQENLYAATPMPADMDDALDFMRDHIQIDLPGADLLYSDIYDGLTWNQSSARYIGKEDIDGKSVDHLAFRTADVDFQIWIQDSDQPLPMRYLITSKWVAGAPQYGVEMSNWIVNPQLDPKTFEFKGPTGATQIEFLTSQGVQP